MPHALERGHAKAFAADTVALVTFFTLTGILNERFVAGMAWPQVLSARLIGAFLMVLTARPYGLYRDFVMTHVRLRATSPFTRDIVALATFQVPIYAAILFVSGADTTSVLAGCLGFTALMIVIGRPYGLYLDFVRRLFGVPPAGGAAPMTIGE